MTYRNLTLRIASKLCQDECLRGRLIRARQDHCYEHFDELLKAAKMGVDLVTQYEDAERKLRPHIKERSVSRAVMEHTIAKCEHIDFT